jgi:uncharacterized protein YifE (UPF0438 family)
LKSFGSDMIEISEPVPDLIKEYYKFYRALDFGVRLPTTPAQKRFVKVCRGRANPTSKHEHAYLNWKTEVDTLLRKYLDFYESLDFGGTAPDTPTQKRFVATCLGNAEPESQHELAYLHWKFKNKAMYEKRERSTPIHTPRKRTIKPDLRHKGASSSQVPAAKRSIQNPPDPYWYDRFRSQRDAGAPIQSSTIGHKYDLPEFEEGKPRSEFGTREDFKSDRAANWSNSRTNKL